MSPNIALLSVVGAIGLLLYGLNIASEAMQRVAGQRLRHILATLGENPLAAVGAGAAITVLMQSSSATTVMLVGFARAGLIEMRQTIGLILGADIGTTLTVQLLAFRVYDYAPLPVAVGAVIFLSSRRRSVRDAGQALLGFGLIFMSLGIIVQSMSPLQGNGLVRQIFMGLGDVPVLVLLLAAIFAAVTTSSAATIGVALVLAADGLLPATAAIPYVLGANVGTSMAALVSSVGGIPEAKRVAFAHVLFKVVGVAIFFPFTGQAAALLGIFGLDPARQLAIFHTLFNVAITLLVLPFSSQVVRIITSLVPDKPSEEALKPRYLDDYALESPALALGQATREALRMADVVQDMVQDSLEVFRTNDEALIERIEKREDQVDYLEEAIKSYLTKLSQNSLTEEQSKREVSIIYLINELEHIGDIVDKSTMQLARQKAQTRLAFSPQGMDEVEELHSHVMENLRAVVTSVATRDAELAQKVLSEKSVINKMERDLRQAHIHRLHAGLRESIETSSIHMDVLNDLKRINSHTANMAYVVLGEL